MTAFATKIAVGFSATLLKEVYDQNLINTICNRDYEGEINGVGSQLNINNIGRISEKDFDGNDMTADDLTENNTLLTIEKKKAFYWKEKTLDKWLSFIKDPHSTVVTQTAGERSMNMDKYGLGFYGDVASGNRVGTDVTTGTVTVDTVTGAVTGSGTTFTVTMVGRGFKAAGHTKWYRVKTFTNTTSIVIEDDLDDVTSAYTGGAIGAGATFTVEAVTPLQITTSNLLTNIGKLKLRLDIAERLGKSTVPAEGRWLVVPPEFDNIVQNASGIALHVDAVYANLVQKGYIGELSGFKLFKSNRLTGDNTNGFRVLAGHNQWMTFAEKPLQVRMEEDLRGNFGQAYKDLFVYGGKVPDVRRHFATEGYWLF